MIARLYSLDGERQSRLAKTATGALRELCDLAGKQPGEYSAGLADGRQRLAKEHGVDLPPRVRSPRDQVAAENTALDENAVRLTWRAASQQGASDACRPKRALRPVARDCGPSTIGRAVILHEGRRARSRRPGHGQRR
jgi:hypothetical protein